MKIYSSAPSASEMHPPKLNLHPLDFHAARQLLNCIILCTLLCLLQHHPELVFLLPIPAVLPTHLLSFPSPLYQWKHRHQGSYNDAGSDIIESCPTLSPFYALIHHTFFIAAFCHLISVKGIPDLFRPKNL